MLVKHDLTWEQALAQAGLKTPADRQQKGQRAQVVLAGIDTPRRAHGGREKREQEDCDLHDRHGIVRCRHCGAPTRLVRFERSSNSGPRLHVACEQPITAGCATTQTVPCKRNWRMLIPMPRTAEAYHALRVQPGELERVHHHWRQRYCVGGEEPVERPKRRGIACQQLRANAAALIEWLIICAREAWVPGLRLKRKKLKATKKRPGHPYERGAKAAAESLKEARAKLGLDQPYGPKAKALQVGELVPTRPKEKPPKPAA